jgi:regulator of nucleoside diphosphate kinase
MKDRTIHLTEFDLDRLKRLLAAKGSLDGPDKQYLRDLKDALDRAVVVPSTDIPPDVITMNSRFRMTDLDTGEESEYTLVFPGTANIVKGRLSVLAPVGTALLGRKESDVIEWTVPVGIKRFRIDKVLYQPEAAEAFHL